MLSVEQIKKLALDRGYAALVDNYTTRSETWRQVFTDVQVPTAENMTDFPFGHRAVGVVGLGEMRKVTSGERIEEDTVAEGYTRQTANPMIATKMTIDGELLKTRNAEVIITGQVIDFARRAAMSASRYKNNLIAGMMQKGTLAAGSVDFFDQRYRGESDANLGFIYDGKPWFAATGNAHPFKAYTAAGAEGVNLTASALLSTTTLNDAYTIQTSTNAKDERGQNIDVMSSKLVVGTANRQTAIAVCESELLPGSGNNDRNSYAGLIEPIVFSDLTDDADAWWLFADDGGLKIYDSGIPEIVVRADEDRRLVILEAKYYFGASVKDWRYGYCANKATT